jgi:uncharacterized membrane protein
MESQMTDSASTGVQTTSGAIPEEKLRGAVLAINILYAAACFIGISAVVAVVLAYIRRDDARSTMWEGHLIYAIRTFWIGFALMAIGGLLSIIGIGLIILGLGFIWYVIRVVKGFVAWSDAKPIANPRGFF